MATWTLAGAFTRSVISKQSTTDSAPTLATDGMNMDSVAGFNLYVACDTGQTFTGTGTFPAYVYDSTAGGWAKSDTSLDLAVFPLAIGKSLIVYTGFTVASPRGQIAHIATGVGVTGGGLTLTYTCNSLHGERI